MLSSSRRRFLKAGTVATTAGLTGIAGCLGGGSDGALRFNYVVPIENFGSLLDIPEIQDEMDNLGDSYELEVSHDASTPDTINAMAAGEADMGMVTIASFGNAAVSDAIPGGITAITTDFWDAHPDHFAVPVYSLPDSDITEPEDLEGATLAVNALGTGIHAVYAKMLTEVGLDPEEDVEFVEQSFPTFISGLEDGIFDAAIFPALFAVTARNNDFTQVFTSRDAFGEDLHPYPFTFTAASGTALDEKEDEIQAWTEDFQGVFEYVQENRDEVVSIAAEHFELPEDQVDAFFMTENGYYRDFENDVDAIQGIMDELNELGILEDQFDAEAHVTNEYLS